MKNIKLKTPLVVMTQMEAKILREKVTPSSTLGEALKLYVSGDYFTPAVFYQSELNISHQGVHKLGSTLEDLKNQGYRSFINEAKGIEMFISREEYPEYFL